MGYTVVPTFTANQVITAADLNTYLRDNISYLFSKPLVVVRRDNGSNYTTTSTSFTPIDTTNLSATISISTGRVMLGLIGVLQADTAADKLAHFDFEQDGTRVNIDFSAGLQSYQLARAVGERGVPVSMIQVYSGVSVGTHIYKPLWKVRSAGTAVMYSGNGTTDEDFPIIFFAMEI